MSEEEKDTNEDWRNVIKQMMSENPKVRCHSYRCLKNGMERGLRIKEPFSAILADCIRSESYGHLQSLMELVETYLGCHKETLYEDYKGYTIFKAFLYKYHEHVGACLNIMFLNHTLLFILEAFPNKFLLILTIKLFGEAPHPINVTLQALYVAQSVTQVTGEEIPLITSLTPFEVLRDACITLMDMINTYKSYPELDIYQWSEDMIVALWFTNRSQMMEVFKSLPGDVQKEVASMIKNYGSTKYGALDSKLPLEMEAMIKHVEVDVQSICDKCDWSVRNISEQERSFSIQETLSKDSLSPQIYEEPKRVGPVRNFVTPDVYKAKMEKDSTEKPDVDATKFAARKSILNLLKYSDILPASNEDLSKLALDVKTGGKEHDMLYDNQQNQKGMKENDELAEELKQEELNSLQSTSDMNRESCEENIKVSPKQQEEITGDIQCEIEFDTPYEIEVVQYDTDDSQEYEDISDEVSEEMSVENELERIQQNQKGTQDNDELPEEHKQEELNSLQSTSDMNRETCEENIKVSPKQQEEITGDIKCETDIEGEIEEVQYNTDGSQEYEDLSDVVIEEITVGKVLKRSQELNSQCKEPDENEVEHDSFLPDFSSQWESAEFGEPSTPRATASGTVLVPVETASGTLLARVSSTSRTASVSRIKSLLDVPSKITSLFKGRGFKSQTNISEQRVEVVESKNSSARMYTEAQKLIRDEIESVVHNILKCKMEINSTELELEQLREKIRNNNMLIQKREKKMKDRFSVVTF